MFITSLLVIVAAQRGGHVEKEINGDTGSAEGGNLENNALWRTISKQVETLRTEMEDSRKSAEEAAQNASSGESYPYITFVSPY